MASATFNLPTTVTNTLPIPTDVHQSPATAGLVAQEQLNIADALISLSTATSIPWSNPSNLPPALSSAPPCNCLPADAYHPGCTSAGTSDLIPGTQVLLDSQALANAALSSEPTANPNLLSHMPPLTFMDLDMMPSTIDSLTLNHIPTPSVHRSHAHETAMVNEAIVAEAEEYYIQMDVDDDSDIVAYMPVVHRLHPMHHRILKRPPPQSFLPTPTTDPMDPMTLAMLGGVGAEEDMLGPTSGRYKARLTSRNGKPQYEVLVYGNHFFGLYKLLNNHY